MSKGLDVPDRSTIYEVAQRSGVSTATVSRVMAAGKGFSEATRERVRATGAERAGPGAGFQACRGRRAAVPRSRAIRRGRGGVAAVRGSGDPRRGTGGG